MKYWPVPDSYPKNVPEPGFSGSFWEKRGDRHHCGIDVYAPEGSNVISIEDGMVIDIGIFTSPDKITYWNTTYYILIKNNTGLICKYAELGDVTVKIGKSVVAGQLIGHVGLVLNADEINHVSPAYIKKLKATRNQSMLHFELYGSFPPQSKKYLGGNWFGHTKPKNMLNPTNYLKSVLNKNISR